MAELTLRQLLEDIVQRRASDLHLTAGVPPELRIDGAITPTEYEVLTPEKCIALAYSVLSNEQRMRFETTKELDFSFGVKGLSRYRANVYLQRRASDLHLTAGVPPELRIDGAITPTEYEVLTPEKCIALAYSVLSNEQRKRFETTKELDFSFGVSP